MFRAPCNRAPAIVFGVIIFGALFFGPWPAERLAADVEKTYVGAKACEECHEEEYEHYEKFAKKAHSYSHIKTMKKGLTEAEFRSCFECHTTGYGQPGGFKSEQETPDLKNAGCETCHGPGSVHVETQDPEDIKASLTDEECGRCHNSERVKAFGYKPLIYGGAH
ncbi:MAG: cytochrome C [Deltaproteobacteria bacterium]|nr:cytochrome C [Deltaproteobacteria bacterium]